MTFRQYFILWCAVVIAWLTGFLNPPLRWAAEKSSMGAAEIEIVLLIVVLLNAFWMTAHFFYCKGAGENPWKSKEPFID